MFFAFFIALLLITQTSSLINNHGGKTKVIDAFYSNVTVISGHKAALICTFGGNNDDLSLSSSHQLIWIRQSSGSHNADSILAHNQDLLISDYRLNIQRTDIDYSLTISNANIDDEGVYACEVNTQPPQKALIHLYVQEIPMIIDNATSSPIVVNEYENVTMKCQARGRPTPYVAWLRRGDDGKELTNQTRFAKAVLANNTDGLFHFVNLTREQNGHYECRVSNGVNDHVVSKHLELRVLFIPVIRAQTALVHGTIGKSAHLRCSATAPSDTKLYWRRMNNHTISSETSRYHQQQHVHNNLFQTTVFIRDLEKTDFGSYGCYAESKAGRSSAVIELKEHSHPHPSTTTEALTTVRTPILKRNKISEQTTATQILSLNNSSFKTCQSVALLIFLILFLYL